MNFYSFNFVPSINYVNFSGIITFVPDFCAILKNCGLPVRLSQTGFSAEVPSYIITAPSIFVRILFFISSCVMVVTTTLFVTLTMNTP